MICPICKENVTVLRIMYKKEERLEGCKHCLQITDLYPSDIIDGSISSTMSVKHRNDIERRKIDWNTPNRHVIRDYGRKSFMVK